LTNRIKVLVVDDSEPYAHLVQEAIRLTQHVCEIEIAHDGLDAFEKLKSSEHTDHRYKLVITDLSLRIMSGFDLLRAIRQSENLKDLPVVAMSSDGRPDVSEIVLALGANAFIEKQSNISVISNEIENAIQKHVVSES
jgi:CheY-like chemotaxis protein